MGIYIPIDNNCINTIFMHISIHFFTDFVNKILDKIPMPLILIYYYN